MTTRPAITSLLLSRRDLQFLLYEWLEIEQLSERPRYAGQSREIYDDVLELAERLATDMFAPHNRESDVDEPHLEDGRVVLTPGVGEALAAFARRGSPARGLDESVGGMQLPLVLSSAVFAWFHAANTGTTGYAMLTTAAANMLVANAAPDQVERWVPPMVEGRFFGTMCLSEPQAGSSLADITTRAVPQADGTYRLFGTKMWISGGEHELAENIVHLVLAKTPDGPPGVKGISLFIVPRFLLDEDGRAGEPNDVVLAGLNHKMGYRGTVNTVLGFGEGSTHPGGERGAVGYLVGEPHRGLAYMFRMMNEARIGVGLGATALGYTGYLKSLQYARERPQGRSGRASRPRRPAGPDHRARRRAAHAARPEELRRGRDGARALLRPPARRRREPARTTKARQRALLLLDILTPIAKSWPSQWCLEANSLAIQIHGGYGYSREYDVEQHYRDNRLNPIHEGTHGIQALDLLGRKVTMQDGAAFRELTEAIRAGVEKGRGRGGEAAELAGLLDVTLARLEVVTGEIWGSGDVAGTLANATAYLEATGHIVVAWMWLEQFLAARRRARRVLRGQAPGRAILLPLRAPAHRPAARPRRRSCDRTALEMQDDWY